MTEDEHIRRFSQGVPIGELPEFPTILTVNDLQDHSKLIAQTCVEHFEDFDVASDSYFFSTYGRYSQSQLVTMKERLVGDLGVRL